MKHILYLSLLLFVLAGCTGRLYHRSLVKVGNAKPKAAAHHSPADKTQMLTSRVAEPPAPLSATPKPSTTNTPTEITAPAVAHKRLVLPDRRHLQKFRQADTTIKKLSPENKPVKANRSYHPLAVISFVTSLLALLLPVLAFFMPVTSAFLLVAACILLGSISAVLALLTLAFMPDDQKGRGLAIAALMVGILAALLNTVLAGALALIVAML